MGPAVVPVPLPWTYSFKNPSASRSYSHTFFIPLLEDHLHCFPKKKKIHSHQTNIMLPRPILKPLWGPSSMSSSSCSQAPSSNSAWLWPLKAGPWPRRPGYHSPPRGLVEAISPKTSLSPGLFTSVAKNIQYAEPHSEMCQIFYSEERMCRLLLAGNVFTLQF